MGLATVGIPTLGALAPVWGLPELQSVAVVVEAAREKEVADTLAELARHEKSDMRCHECTGRRDRTHTALVPKLGLRVRMQSVMDHI